MKKKNNKGFTLVELLAALVILGLLVAIAAPNVVGMMQRTKLNNYIDDAKKLKSLAEYKFRGDTSITRPTSGQCIKITMNYLGTTEFTHAPNGGAYDPNLSYVVIEYNSNMYKYSVQLVEKEENNKYSGINLTDYSNLTGDSKYEYIKTRQNDFETKNCITNY